jgi:2-dehydropantoate 2-reductase
MRLLIFGTGGVGGYIGANLCEHNDEVTVVARGAHLRAIREKGLRVVEDEKEYTVLPDNTIDETGLTGIYDFVLLGVKGYDIDHALNVLAPHVDSQTVVLPIANGVDHFDKIAQRLDVRLLKGCCYILARVALPGVIRKKGKVFAIVFGSDADPDAVQTAKALFENAGLRYKIPEDIDTAVWKKYIFISAFATLTSYYDMNIKSVAEHHPDETKTLLTEIAAVAHAKGADIDEEIQKSIETALSLPESASTSMHLDFQKGRPTELESLTGFIVKEGKKVGVSTPLAQSLYTHLQTRS